jgi:hypothetical protein
MAAPGNNYIFRSICEKYPHSCGGLLQGKITLRQQGHTGNITIPNGKLICITRSIAIGHHRIPIVRNGTSW